MSITTIETRVTHRSLMNKSKNDLADMVLMLMDMNQPKPAPLRVLEVELEPMQSIYRDDASVLTVYQEFPKEFAGKRVRCVIEEVGE